MSETLTFSPKTYTMEVNIIQKRVNRRKTSGKPFTSADVRAWIKERQPSWENIDQEELFRQVNL